jgi:TolB-like protein
MGLTVVAIVAGVVGWIWFRGGAPAPRVTLAVLPFENIGSDPEREYLAAGLTEETSASLAQIDPERLIVKGRTLRYKGTTKTAVEIGQELSVDYLVESTIRAEGARLRVTATLIRVQDQEHVWSRSYERQSTSFLGLQQELSTAIADQIRVRLSPDDVRGGEAGRPRTRMRSMRISGDVTSRAGERLLRTPALSRSISGRSRSTPTMHLPGPAWLSRMPAVS